MESITSRKNPLITHIRKLCTDRSYRRQCGEFVGDGVKLLDEAVRWGAALTAVVCTEDVSLPALPDAVRVVQVPVDVMESVSPMKSPQGALFVCEVPTRSLPEQLTGCRYLVLDGVQDPGNVGTIWRTADALGADGVLLLDGCADPWSAKTVRSTMGACFRLPVYELTREQLADRTQGSGLPLYATALLDDTVDLRAADLRRCAVVIGSEGRGVSREVLDLCDQTMKIPMRDRCESLNAAAAAAVVLWEMARGD